MTTGGWINLLVSVGAVCVLFFWCLYRVLFCAPPEHLHGIEDIKTPDENQD